MYKTATALHSLEGVCVWEGEGRMLQLNKSSIIVEYAGNKEGEY